MRAISILFSLCIILLLNGCSASKFGWKVEKGDGPIESDSEQVEDFDPLTLEDDEFSVADVSKNNNGSSSTLSDEQTDSTVQMASANDVSYVRGYRIQLRSFVDHDNAVSEKRKAMMKFNETVYLDFESAMYKLRVGDFTLDQKKGAYLLRDEAVRLGYPDAWVVGATVKTTQSKASSTVE